MQCNKSIATIHQTPSLIEQCGNPVATSCNQQRTSLTEVIANKDSLRHVTETEILKTHDHFAQQGFCLEVVNRFCSQVRIEIWLFS